MSFDEFDEELEENIEEKVTRSKTPAYKAPAGRKITIYVISTIGPGEKKQKLTVDNGNQVSDIKRTVGNIFGLNPSDFHVSSGGVTMDEKTPLNNYNLSDGDDVLLIPASTAG